ncbi:uncharacterized protein VTP21DRAFT_4489 [Calcarisporiella thermophila]|uniref:uncharacterized protein n=1 Tax=Calcarisporiella thermophila TaxID=911321 RepID=UPI003741FEC6
MGNVGPIFSTKPSLAESQPSLCAPTYSPYEPVKPPRRISAESSGLRWLRHSASNALKFRQIRPSPHKDVMILARDSLSPLSPFALLPPRVPVNVLNIKEILLE